MKRWLWLSVVLVAAGLAVGWAYRPREDYSSPRATAKTFYVGLMRGYDQIARRSLIDPQQADVLPEMRTLVTNVVAAQDAAEKKWGNAGKSVDSGLPSLDDIEQADVTVQGGDAVLAPKKLDALRARFRKIKGEWKLDLLSTFHLDGEKPDTVKRILNAMASGAADVKAGIESGKLKSAQEADQKLKASLITPVMALQLERQTHEALKSLWGK